MYESAQRLPSTDALAKISTALGLDAFQKGQLQVVAGYSNRANSPGHEWLVPDDVLHGVPIFLRKLEKESEFQRDADISEMWIVANKPIALDGKMYEMLRKRLSQDKTKFVYFIGGRSGEESFRALWDHLCSDIPRLKTVIREKLQCVLAPASLCLYHFGICNPGQQSRMFGRAIMYQNGLPVGFYAMDILQVGRAYELLELAYDLCTRNEGKKMTTDYGAFQLITPVT